MPDTGSPWNIPYVEPSDLVRDYPSDSEDLANAIADGLDEAGNAGIGSNVVTATNSSVFTTSSATYTPVTSMSVSITLSSATSKVLVFATSAGLSNSSSGDFAHVAIERDGNLLQESVARSVTGFYYDPWASFIVDTPGSVGPHTYTLQAKQSSGGNARVEVSTDGSIILTAIEVAA